MKNLTNREQNIVLATIRFWNVNLKSGYVPDYELVEPSFDPPTEAKRDIRDLIQEVSPCIFTHNDQAQVSSEAR